MRGFLRVHVDFKTSVDSPFKAPFQSLRALLLPASPCVKFLKSASTKISIVTNQGLTRGLFKRLNGVIAYPEEITNSRLSFGRKRMVSQLLCTGYGSLFPVRTIKLRTLSVGAFSR